MQKFSLSNPNLCRTGAEVKGIPNQITPDNYEELLQPGAVIQVYRFADFAPDGSVLKDPPEEDMEMKVLEGPTRDEFGSLYILVLMGKDGRYGQMERYLSDIGILPYESNAGDYEQGVYSQTLATGLVPK